MSLLQRLFWGFLAGLVIIIVKIIGPDQDYVRSLFDLGYSAQTTFYAFISFLTILLGTISALFNKEKEPIKLLLFCASVPALLSTYTGEVRNSVPGLQDDVASSSINRTSTGSFGLPTIFFSTAFAQTINTQDECVEPGFAAEFSKTAQQYLSGRTNAAQTNYSVIVASIKDLEEAKALATKIFTTNRAWSPYVGCRRPGNEYFPVIIGTATTEVEATELKVKFEAAEILSAEPYLSSYEYRTEIFTPQ